MENKYYFSPWEDEFLLNIATVKEKITLVAPFVKFSTIKKIFSFLPTDKKIELTLITRFTKQVFLQKSSDLELFNYLVNYDFENITNKCYRLNNLHSKIYIIDSEKLFITSSNLSYSGFIKNHEVAIEINNPTEIKMIKAELQPLMNEEHTIKDFDINDMSEILHLENVKNFKERKPVYKDAETDETENDLIIKDEKTLILQNIDTIINNKNKSIQKQIQQNEILENVTKFKQRSRIEMMFLDNKEFSTVGLRIDDSREFDQLAAKDLKILEDRIRNLFSVEINGQKDFLDDLVASFIHLNWIKNFKDIAPNTNTSRKRLFQILGNSIFKLIVDLEIIKTKSFTANQNQVLNDIARYTRTNYSFEDVLKQINCNVFLYTNDITVNFSSTIFAELMGVLYYYLGYDKFIKLFNQYLNIMDQYVLDEYQSIVYKTLLQELTQTKFGLPRYELVKEVGEDHNKVFFYEVYIKNNLFGSASGYSKKQAQEDAAEVASKKYLKEFGYLDEKSKTIKLKKYRISNSRILELEKLNKLLFKPIKNLTLLDIVFTHTSYIKAHPESRDNSNLAYLGSRLEEFCRISKTITSYKELNDDGLKDCLEMFKNIKVSSCLENYFDKHNFKNYVLGNFETIGMPQSIKVTVIQALIAVHYFEYGISDTIKLVFKMWDLYKVGAQIHQDYTGMLQDIIQKEFKEKKIVYETIKEFGLDNSKRFELGCLIDDILYGSGIASNKKEARRLAAKNTLENKDFIEKFIAVSQ